MKKLMLALVAVALGFSNAAFAADMAVKARPAPPAPIFSWTGFYIGAHAGGAWFDKDWFVAADTDQHCRWMRRVPGTCRQPQRLKLARRRPGRFQLPDRHVGVRRGSRCQRDRPEGDQFESSRLAPIFLINSRTDAVGTIAGRVGVASNQALFYVKGGGAWANDRFFTSGSGVIPPPPLVGVPLQQADDTRWGWMVGVGVEYAFTPNWSVKAEYNYLDLGTRRETLQPVPANCPGCGPFQYDIRQRMDLVKIGLNYRFGWAGPVVAKY